MKTTKFALALAALTAISIASAQLQVRNELRTARIDAPITIDESDLKSLSISAGQPAFGSGGGAGKVSYSDLSIMHVYDKATPKLARLVRGNHYPTVLITVRKAGKEQQDYYVIKLTDVTVDRYQAGMSSGGDRPMESLSLNFTKIEFDYRPKRDR